MVLLRSLVCNTDRCGWHIEQRQLNAAKVTFDTQQHQNSCHLVWCLMLQPVPHGNVAPVTPPLSPRDEAMLSTPHFPNFPAGETAPVTQRVDNSNFAESESLHWVIRTSFEPQSVLYQFSVSQIPLKGCAPDVPVALILSTTSTRHVRTFLVQGSDRHQRLLLFWSRQRDSVEVFLFLSLEPLPKASHPCFDSDPSRGVTVRNTSLCPHL